MRIKKIICNGIMHSLALKQRLGAVTENILTPSSHGKSLKILLRGGGGVLGVFKSISLLMGGDSTSLCKDPTPPPPHETSKKGAPTLFPEGGGGGVHRLGVDSLLNEEVTDI